MRSLPLKAKTKALSVSVGDGVWDYLTFQSAPSVQEIVATDIVDNPLSKENEKLLQIEGKWSFVKVKPEKPLPFKDASFDLVFHHDVIEHVNKPYLFLAEQYRVLKKGGSILFGTPNIHRPANIAKLCIGSLTFPLKIGYNKEIGDYIHIQEFYKEQLQVMLAEIGFTEIEAHYSFFGLHFLNLTFQKVPKTALGKGMCHYLMFTARK